MYNFEISRYYNSNSIIHNINPLFKILCLLLFSFLVIWLNNLLSLSILFCFAIILIILTKVPIRLYIKNLKFSFGLSIFIVLIDMIFKIPLIVSIISVVKLILFLLYSGILIYTTTPNDITYGLECFLSPLKIFKVDTSMIALTISLALRFIPIIFMQTSKVLRSQYSRGLNFSGSLKEKCNKLLSIIIPIFTLSIDRCDAISDSLMLRLYSSNRTSYKIYKVTKYDYIILFSHCLLLIMFIMWRIFI